MKDDNLAIFISTSRNTEDVFLSLFDINCGHLSKFGCRYFVGCNNASPLLRSFLENRGVTLVDLKFETNWNDEIEAQVEYMKEAYNLNSFVLLLDDFLIESVDYSKLRAVKEGFLKKELDYVRLKEPVRIKSLIRRSLNSGLIYRIKRGTHYYNSLQIAFWRVDAFLACVKNNKSDSIWKFEWLELTDNWSVYKSALLYDHVIEKGKVRKSKVDLLSTHCINLESTRSVIDDTGILYKVKSFKFYIFGYLFSRRL